jgi:hypothetical protein
MTSAGLRSLVKPPDHSPGWAGVDLGGAVTGPRHRRAHGALYDALNHGRGNAPPGGGRGDSRWHLRGAPMAV